MEEGHTDRQMDGLPFCVGHSQDAKQDFGVYSRGYWVSAQALAERLCAKAGYGDHEAYPILFLYRHALELALKNVICRCAALASVRGRPEWEERLPEIHDLSKLASVAERATAILFPRDGAVRRTMQLALSVADAYSLLDRNSYAFRYPTAKGGRPAFQEKTVLSLSHWGSRFDDALLALDAIDMWVDANSFAESEVLGILSELDRLLEQQSS